VALANLLFFKETEMVGESPLKISADFYSSIRRALNYKKFPVGLIKIRLLEERLDSVLEGLVSIASADNYANKHRFITYAHLVYGTVCRARF
jgi:hypothetical protein